MLYILFFPFLFFSFKFNIQKRKKTFWYKRKRNHLNLIPFCKGFHNSLKYQWAWSAIECYKRFVPPHPSPIGRWMDQ